MAKECVRQLDANTYKPITILMSFETAIPEYPISNEIQGNRTKFLIVGNLESASGRQVQVDNSFIVQSIPDNIANEIKLFQCVNALIIIVFR